MATQFINQADLDAAFKNYNTTITPESFDFSETISPEATSLLSTPPPTSRTDKKDEKQTKKRRSWGQQLPAPTTNLPPRYDLLRGKSLDSLLTHYRKRAKTEAEKEQRRIERVIRNRLAAHSSRERKRKEVECLEDQKSVVETENYRLKQQVVVLASKNRQLEEEVNALRAELGKPRREPESSLEPAIKQEPEHYNSIPSPPSSNASSTVDPRDSFSPAPSTPAMESHDFAASSDMTQHPAEML